MAKDVMLIIDLDNETNGKPTVSIEPSKFEKSLGETMKIHVVMRFGGKLSSLGNLEIRSKPVYAETPEELRCQT